MNWSETIWLIFHNDNKMDKRQYYQQMLQWLDIHTEKKRRDRSTRTPTSHSFTQKETQNGPQTEVENGESIKLLEDIRGEYLGDF